MEMVKTYLALAQADLELVVLCEGDPILHNPYAVIAANPDKNPSVNREGAGAFVDFLFSPAAQTIISTFGQEQYGEPLFHLIEEEPTTE